MNIKSKLMDASAIDRSLSRISHEIIERNTDIGNLCLVGIERRGAELSDILINKIEKFSGLRPAHGKINIRFYRDDLSKLNSEPYLESSPSLPFPVDGANIILVDDVLYTGRTVRAAIDAIFSLGRPDKIQLAILVDRGHRELPIKADYVGKNVPSSKKEHILVCTPSFDGSSQVLLVERDDI